MNVLGHQKPGVDLQIGFLTGFGEVFMKIGLVLVIEENSLRTFPAVPEVANSSTRPTLSFPDILVTIAP